MSELTKIFKKIKESPQINSDLLKQICRKVKLKLNGIREVMYSDIINIIVRESYIGEDFNQLIIWCNYNIKNGKFFVKF